MCPLRTLHDHPNPNRPSKFAPPREGSPLRWFAHTEPWCSVCCTDACLWSVRNLRNSSYRWLHRRTGTGSTANCPLGCCNHASDIHSNSRRCTVSPGCRCSRVQSQNHCWRRLPRSSELRCLRTFATCPHWRHTPRHWCSCSNWWGPCASCVSKHLQRVLRLVYVIEGATWDCWNLYFFIAIICNIYIINFWIFSR